MTELTRNSRIFLAATCTGSDGDTIATLISLNATNLIMPQQSKENLHYENEKRSSEKVQLFTWHFQK